MRKIKLFVAALGASLTLTFGLAIPAQATTSSADTMLQELAVEAESPSSTYNRDLFPHWITVNGCNTRARVLIEESLTETTRSGTCTIQTGTWLSMYDGQTYTAATNLDIDHMIPLAEAWISGASTWTTDRRRSFANDVTYAYSLIAVDASSNRSKGDRDPDSWLPSDTSAQCDYAKMWVAVKWRWNLTIDSAEKSAITAALDTCENLSIDQPTRA